MKKYFNNKQIAILTIALIAFVLASVFTLSLCFNAPVVARAYNSNEEIYYAGIGGAIKETESFSYATKTEESYLINPTFPNYFNGNGSLTNTCANVAGANIIGYYDRYYDNLIPDVSVGYVRNNKYSYYPMSVNSSNKQAVINELYQLMQTNLWGEGNTQTQYKNGLSSYVQGKGLSISFESVMTNGSFDLNKAIGQFQNGRPISLFMSGFNFTNITDNGNTVTYDKSLYDANHIAIAYGYEKVNYYDANGYLLRAETYLIVSTGLKTVTGVYILNKYGTLNDAESASIY